MCYGTDLTHDPHFAGANEMIDVGCGAPTFLSRLLPLFPHLRYTGIDISPTLIRTLRSALASLAEREEGAQTETEERKGERSSGQVAWWHKVLKPLARRNAKSSCEKTRSVLNREDTL